jgi:hypothetical protein
MYVALETGPPQKKPRTWGFFAHLKFIYFISIFRRRQVFLASERVAPRSRAVAEKQAARLFRHASILKSAKKKKNQKKKKIGIFLTIWIFLCA